jgi:peptide chain release factor 3
VSLADEIKKRRTFAIISHPDAGKTTLTEKLLLYGNAIQMAGSVKAKRSKKFATSDWMELEKQRGISVTSSVMKFPYQGHEINLIDTPGHQDFSEDTYRTLTAVDSVLMLIDAGNGVEEQTKKLFEVCRMRRTPIMAFINKMDRPGRPPLELLEEIEQTLGIATFPITWPVGQGDLFQGVYHRSKGEMLLYEKNAERSQIVPMATFNSLGDQVDPETAAEVTAELDLLDGAGESFAEERYLQGDLVPVLFGSALNNFGVEILLDYLISLAPAPLSRPAKERAVMPEEGAFSGFIFKIQANMDTSHRDRVAFMRICSGQFVRGMKAYHVRHKRLMRLGRPTQFMAQDRSLVDEAFAGDIVGIHDPGVFKIGDSLSEGESLHFADIPVFAPERFVKVQLAEPLKSKQLTKGLEQLSEEGAVQVFRSLVNSNEQILGVVGILQIDVVQFRLQAEYGVKVNMHPIPYTAARWVSGSNKAALDKFTTEQAPHLCRDVHGNLTLLLDHHWRLRYHQERHPDVVFKSTSDAVLAE